MYEKHSDDLPQHQRRVVQHKCNFSSHQRRYVTQHLDYSLKGP